MLNESRRTIEDQASKLVGRPEYNVSQASVLDRLTKIELVIAAGGGAKVQQMESRQRADWVANLIAGLAGAGLMAAVQWLTTRH